MSARIVKNEWNGVIVRFAALTCWTAVAAAAQGCGPPTAERPGYMPSWDEARLALVSALGTWHEGSEPLPVSPARRAVEFIDKRRRPDQRLLAFQILAQTDVENARQFTVRLNLDGEETPRLVKYNVVGRDPIWVFSLEDYEMFSHWEHDMDEVAPAAEQQSKDPRRLEPAR